MPPATTTRRKSPPFRAARPPQRPNAGATDKPEHEILFQTYFKSVGPRTYAAQVKKASNDNHYLVLTEGKRDEKTGEVRKARLFVYSEDFVAFFRMLQETSLFIRANPVPDEVKQRRTKFWAKKDREAQAPHGTRSDAVNRTGRPPVARTGPTASPGAANARPTAAKRNP